MGERLLSQITPHQSNIHLNNDDPVGWILENFRIPETPDKRLILHPYQSACLREALRRDGDKFVYSTVLWSDIKKSIKSTLAAAVILWRAYHSEWGQILVIANDLRQADSRVGYYIRRAIELNPDLKRDAKIRNYRIELHNHSIIESIPIDPTGEAGSNADMVVFSELWGAHHKAQLRMWTESTLPPAKFGYSQRWIESYAGFQSESDLLIQLYETGTKHGQPIRLDNAPDDLEIWSNATARMFCLWNTKPRLSWQTDEYYAQEQSILTPDEFARVHRNQWAMGESVFVPAQWWEACRQSSPDLRAQQGCILGLDAGLHDDCFALVLVSKDGEYVDMRECKVWYPKNGDVIDFAEVETEIRRMIGRYKIEAIVYDEMHVPYLVQRLNSLAFWKKFDQGKPRALSDKTLYDLIREGRIRHNGDTELTKHIIGANRKPEEDSKLRIVKRDTHSKIDAAVALSMAAYQIMQWNM